MHWTNGSANLHARATPFLLHGHGSNRPTAPFPRWSNVIICVLPLSWNLRDLLPKNKKAQVTNLWRNSRSDEFRIAQGMVHASLAPRHLAPARINLAYSLACLRSVVYY